MATVTEAKLLGATDPDSYQKALYAILADLGTLSGQAETAAVRILGEARKEVIDRLAQLGLESPSRAMYQRALAGVDQATANMAADLGKTLEQLQAQAVGLGFDMAIKPIAGERGLEILAASITQDQLRILSSYSADLIGGLEADIRKRINGELASVVIGAKSPQSAAVAIGRNLTDKNHFSTIAHRARAIVVTEVGRAQALGTQAGMATLAGTLKKAGDTSTVRKRWLNAHLPGARITHLEAEAKYGPEGSIGPIPVDQLFEIGGFKALYPKDPSLPASESVHCHCVTVTVIDEGSFAAVAQGPPVQAAQAAYTAAKVKAAAPADIATTKGLLGQKAAAFAADPWTAAGLKAEKVLKNGQNGYGGTALAKALGYTDPKQSGFVYDHTLGAFKHKNAPDGKQLPKPYHLADSELKALMAQADLDPGEQSQILAQAAKAKKANPPPIYAVKKPDVPAAPPPPAAFTATFPEPAKVPAAIAHDAPSGHVPPKALADAIPEPHKTTTVFDTSDPDNPPGKVYSPEKGWEPYNPQLHEFDSSLGEWAPNALSNAPTSAWRYAPDGKTVQIFTPATGKWVKYNPATDVWTGGISSGGGAHWVRTPIPKRAVRRVATAGEPSPLGILKPAYDPLDAAARDAATRTMSREVLAFQARGAAIAKTAAPTLAEASALKINLQRQFGAALRELDDATPGSVDRALAAFPTRSGTSFHHHGDNAEKLADTLIQAWAATSGDSHPGALAMQRAAADLFDLPWPPAGYNFKKGTGGALSLLEADALYDAHATVFKVFLQAMYEATQKELARLYPGRTSVTLARGLKRKVANTAGLADIMMNPLSSFSVAARTAKSFGGAGTIMYVEVPFERIIGTALTGYGCFHEFEMVVLGSQIAETVVALSTGAI